MICSILNCDIRWTGHKQTPSFELVLEGLPSSCVQSIETKNE
ncbi:hypothetical protein PFLA_a1169 [Pseudoalteromonas flavipulchra NCIMB 2033 = ATCC BAA-314]|nr:hypothetical protein [Pseudoalteromonas flavipulchra NCIMB 2033 = ATCC BAA-314]